MKALLVVDMVNDFMTGKIANPRAERIVPHIQQLLEQARADSGDWLVVYANDAHLPSDFELPKRFYSAFHETGLDPLLRQFGVDTLVLTGQHTNLCVRHTTADAFFRGYQVIVPPDAVEALSDEDHQSGLRYLEAMYKVDQPDSKQLLQL